jgi:CHAT domain-containing protein
VVHIATHGQFSSDPEGTFILLWDRVLNVRELDNLLRPTNRLESEIVDLLVLSACETAAGDKRASLGLAGVAVRTGARSTLATLWQVNDESTAALMGLFYQKLSENPAIAKAEALRQAQLELWKNIAQDWQVPFFWASYVLVGNWL